MINEPAAHWVCGHTPIASEGHCFISLIMSMSVMKGEFDASRKITRRYQAGRSNDLLKLKRHHDAEATVIGYKTGTGK
ncbi:hypothetical protein OK016_18605 [Vibrio chagasii]|nr:hypothetical protein [Vibrio chagasii]